MLQLGQYILFEVQKFQGFYSFHNPIYEVKDMIIKPFYLSYLLSNYSK